MVWRKQATYFRFLALLSLVTIVCAAAGFAGRHGSAAAAGLRAPIAPDWKASSAPRQLIVGLTDIGQADPTAELRAAGMAVIEMIPELGIAVIASPSSDSVVMAAQLENRGLVRWAEPNYLLTLDLIPNDPDYVGHQLLYLSKMEMDTAWDTTIGRPEIVVAVIDTGIDMAHEDLVGGIWTNPGEIADNGVDDDGNGYIDDVHGWDFAEDDNNPDDDFNHGTHVAGSIGARVDNGIGIAGMAGGITLMPVDIFASNTGSYADLIRGMVYATDNGAKIINLSLGASSYSRGEEAAVQYALSHDVVVVAAAGNTGRAVYHYPAAQPGVIGVSATDARDNFAGFSSRGDFVDVAAPGSSIWSTYTGNRYGSMSGTSMATPHVSGLAALILSVNPTLKPAEVTALITENADDLGDPGRDDMFGYGRINAARTLAAVPLQDVPSPTPTPHPALPYWPIGCNELVTDGGFENPESDQWVLSGDVQVDGTRHWEGNSAAHFDGGSDHSGTMTTTLVLPDFSREATITFAFRIETQDTGWGTAPEMPYDDSFVVQFLAEDGQVIESLLWTGNTADTANDGLSWDHYLYQVPFSDMRQLWKYQTVDLVFHSQNDDDEQPTDVWVDDVHFCATAGHGWYFPWLVN